MENVQKKKIALACVALVIAVATLITVICLVAPRKMSSAVSSKNIDYVKVTLKTPKLQTMEYDPVERILSDDEEKAFIEELNSAKYTRSYQTIKKTNELSIYVYYTDGSYAVFNSCRTSKDGKSIEFANTDFNFKKFIGEELQARYDEIIQKYNEEIANIAEGQSPSGETA